MLNESCVCVVLLRIPAASGQAKSVRALGRLVGLFYDMAVIHIARSSGADCCGGRSVARIPAIIVVIVL